jgi:hypothetical protein
MVLYQPLDFFTSSDSVTDVSLFRAFQQLLKRRYLLKSDRVQSAPGLDAGQFAMELQSCKHISVLPTH